MKYNHILLVLLLDEANLDSENANLSDAKYLPEDFKHDISISEIDSEKAVSVRSELAGIDLHATGMMILENLTDATVVYKPHVEFTTEYRSSQLEADGKYYINDTPVYTTQEFQITDKQPTDKNRLRTTTSVTKVIRAVNSSGELFESFLTEECLKSEDSEIASPESSVGDSDTQSQAASGLATEGVSIVTYTDTFEDMPTFSRSGRRATLEPSLAEMW